MASDNPIGAGNQQERLSPEWVVSFVDGEGCFFVGINRQPAMKVGWQVLPEFRVVQHERDEAVLEQLRRFWDAGGLPSTTVAVRSFAFEAVGSCQSGSCRSSCAYPLRTAKRATSSACRGDLLDGTG